MTKEKAERKTKDMITFQNFCIKNNLTDMDRVGLKSDLNTTEQAEFKEKELTSALEDYRNKPAFKTIK